VETAGPVLARPLDRICHLERRLACERAAREAAERQLEARNLELHATNQNLVALNAELERRVAERTAALDEERRLAIALSERDLLTGLANRARYLSVLRARLSRPDPFCCTALLLLDLDRFKQVNDTLGHAMGDRLLLAVADRLRGFVAAGCLPARMGGDEFALVVSVSGDAIAAAGRLAEQVRQAIAEPYTIDGRSLSIGCSIGIALAPEHATSPEELQVNADLALYKAKALGRGGWSVFTADLVQDWTRRCRLEIDLRDAIAAGQIELVYQPVVSLRKRQVGSVEALARWTHPEFGTVATDLFIDLAEERDLIRPLGRLVLERSCREMGPLLEEGLISSFNVNVSPKQMADPEFVADVRDILARTATEPRCLVLELTESVMLTRSPVVHDNLDALRAIGIRFALDDFGAGYSNLGYLTRLPIQILKIDRDFVQDLDVRSSARTVIAGLTDLAHRLDLTVVVEGVETESQAAWLRASGCDLAQGYLFSRPLPPATLRQALRERQFARPAPSAAARCQAAADVRP